MAISKDIIQQVRDQASIEDVVGKVVTLEPTGRGKLKGLCPFHQEDTPSFTVDPMDNLFYCFGCQEGGDIFNFVQKTRGIGFIQAVTELAEELGIRIEQVSDFSRKQYQKKQTLYDVCQLACEFFHKQLMILPNGQEARDYLTMRGIEQETRTDFSLGFAPGASETFLTTMHRAKVPMDMLVEAGLARYRNPDRRSEGTYAMFRNRLIIPIRNAQGRIVAFGGRRMPSDNKSPAKYVNSPETAIYKKSKTLFGMSFARGVIQRKGRMIIVEGYFDVIALHKNGFKEAIATCGTALTLEHIQILRPLSRKAIALFDEDVAGVRAAEKSLPLFWEGGIEPLKLSLGDSKDPDEYFLLDAHNTETFEVLIGSAEPLFDTKVFNLIQQLGVSPGGIEQIIENVLPILLKMPTLARQASIQSLASKLGVSPQAIQARTVTQDTVEPVRGRATRLYSSMFNDLFWLVIHYPEICLETFGDLDDPKLLLQHEAPNVLTANLEELIIFGRLLTGEKLSEILNEVMDERLRKMLLHQSVSPDVYSAENAALAAGQLRMRFEMEHVHARIIQIQAQLSQILPSDTAKLLELLSSLQNYRTKYEKLNQQVHTPTRSTS